MWFSLRSEIIREKATLDAFSVIPKIRMHLFGQPLLCMSKLGDVYDADETEDQVMAGEGAGSSSTAPRLCRRLRYHCVTPAGHRRICLTNRCASQVSVGLGKVQYTSLADSRSTEYHPLYQEASG